MINNVDKPAEIIKGTLKRVRFASENGEFAVCDLDVPEMIVPVTLVGNILATQPGEMVEVVGKWTENAKFGRQFTIERIQTVLPTTREGIEKYLSSGLIEGIGPVLAGRIVAHFGDEALDIIDAEPARIKEVSGIGKVRAERIIDAWQEGRLTRNIMVFLRSHNISANLASKIFKQYGAQAVDTIMQNPYRLAEDIHGIGFRTADAIAQKAGMDTRAMERLRAGILHCLASAHSDGHMYLPLPILLDQASQLLGVSVELLGDAIEALRFERRVIVEPLGGSETETAPAVFRAPAYNVEVDTARHLRRLIDAPTLLTFGDVRDTLTPIADAMGFELAPAQREAILATFQHKVSVITGGPGTGKTTIIRAVCRVAEKLGFRIALAAPTGRASRRLGEAAELEAQTVHRLLEYSFKAGGFQFNEGNPLDVDLLIIDEASMLDTYLLSAIVRALPDPASLLLVGDIDQLPSVGPGNVLGDVIDSQQVGVVRLTEIFRQAEQSAIVVNAHRINQGEMPVVPNRKPGELVDFYTITADTPIQAQQRILELVTDRIPNAFQFDALNDIQILSPMHKGDVGCAMLNRVLQAHFHQGAEQLERGQQLWKVGDKVMQTRNNYEQDVFNGDIGRITAIHHDQKNVLVRFDERIVTYPFAELDELTLAYAITVHKSQGSEYPVVVIPMVTQHFVLLQRNLLYTALTRARKLAILVGTEEAVGIAVKNNRALSRYTRLSERLQSSPSP